MSNTVNTPILENGTQLVVMTPEQIESMIERAAARAIERNNDTQREIIAETKPSRMMNTREVADRLHVTDVTIRRWKQSGKLIPVEVGGRNLYRSEDIEAILTRI